MGATWDNFTGKDKTSDSMQSRADANANTEKLKQYEQGTTPFAFSHGTGKTTRTERDAFIAFLTAIMTEALRVLKPGGHALIWALPRTSHWTATALEDAGFQIRDVVYHAYAVDAKVQEFCSTLSNEQRNLFEQVLDSQEANSSILHCFGQGFPKSANITQVIQKSYDACQCQTNDVYYQKKDEVYKNVCIEDMPDMRKRAVHSLHDVRQGMRQDTYKKNKGSKAQEYGNMPELRNTIQAQESFEVEQGEVLLYSMLGTTQSEKSSACGAPEKDSRNRTGRLDGRNERSLQTQEHGCEQPCMEGRCNAQEDTRQLSGSDVCTMSTGLSNDGTQGRLCNGAPSSDGSTFGEMSNTGRGSASYRPQSKQQSYQQPSTVSEQFSTQTCGRCGKKIIPQGLGSALKPAVENWILCRKPLSEKNLAENVLKHGTGGLNIDVSRIASSEDRSRPPGKGGANTWDLSPYRTETSVSHTSGRFPANLLISHTLFCTTDACSAECPVLELDRQSGVRKSGGGAKSKVGKPINGQWRQWEGSTSPHVYTANYECEPSQGGASRYFKQFYPPFYYCPKASSRERSSGCEALPGGQGFDKNTSKQIAHINHETGETTYNDYIPSINKNNHPTVKSTQLMNYLCNLICPSNGIVLDMFAGSGSTLVAAVQSNMHFIGIEQSQEYVDIANARIAWARGEMNV